MQHDFIMTTGKPAEKNFSKKIVTFDLKSYICDVTYV